MTTPRPRILISARDPATAHAVGPLVRYARTDSRIRFTLLAQSPALEILQRSVPDVRLLPFPTLSEPKQLLTAARSLLEQIEPDMILSGVSGPDSGVDEALLAAGGQQGIPRYALQSFWGDINDSLGEVAETFFVLDRQAARLTRRRYPVRTIPIGSLRHADYATFDIPGMRRLRRKQLGLDSRQRLVGVFGQPLGDRPGYLETLHHLAAKLAAFPPCITLLYRPHPKETDAQRDRTLTILRLAGLTVHLDSEPLAEPSLCACDLVVSAFSSCGLDALYLNALSPQPLNSVLYLLFNPDLRDWYHSYTRLSDIPPVSAGMALLCSEPDELASTLQYAMQPRTRERCWKKSDQLSPLQQAARKIIDTLVADFDV